MNEHILVLVKHTALSEQISAYVKSDSSHPRRNPRFLIQKIASQTNGVTDFVSRLLDITYPTSTGNHKKGNQVFSLTNSNDNHNYDEIVLVCWDDEYEGCSARIDTLTKPF